MNWWKKLNFKLPQPTCREYAVLTGLACHGKYPVRLISGQTKKGPHIQVQIKIDGQWEWLIGESDIVSIGYQDLAFTGHVREWTLSEYLNLLADNTKEHDGPV